MAEKGELVYVASWELQRGIIVREYEIEEKFEEEGTYSAKEHRMWFVESGVIKELPGNDAQRTLSETQIQHPFKEQLKALREQMKILEKGVKP